MNVAPIQSSIAFQRRLKPEEEAGYKAVLEKAKEKAGNTGISALIVPSCSLPDSINGGTGTGNMLTKESAEFFDFAKLYWGVNYVQLLPEGNYASQKHVFRPYSGSSLDLGLQLINLEALTGEEYGGILTDEDIKEVISANKGANRDTRINYENTIAPDSPTEKALRKAYKNLSEKSCDAPEMKALDAEMRKYYADNQAWLDRKSLFKVLSLKNGTKDTEKWSAAERNLFNPDIVSPEERERLINELMCHSEYAQERSFYIFTQYLADKDLARAKANLNGKGIKLSGDMPVGCTLDEQWMYPKAFYEKQHLPWGFRAINFNSDEGIEFLKLKTRLCAKRYDGIRVDAAWLYAEQKLYGDTKAISDTEKIYGSKILDIVDNTCKEVKGKDFNLQNITYEFAAAPEDYVIYEGSHLKKEVADRIKVYTTQYLGNDMFSVDAHRNGGWKDGTYMLGVTNHDAVSLKDLYKNGPVRDKQIKILSRILRLPKESLQSLSGFMQAKYAEPIRCTHNMFFFSDALNLSESYHSSKPATEQYRLKVPSNWKDIYFESLAKGEGLNVMDAFGKAFVADGLDKKEPELYQQILKYRDILNESEKPKSETGKPGFEGKAKGKGKWLAIAAAAVVAVTSAIVFAKHKSAQKASEIKTPDENSSD